MHVDLNVEDDHEDCPTRTVIPTRVQVERHRAFVDSCFIRVLCSFTTFSSVSSMLWQIAWVSLYFHIWVATLQDFDKGHPGKVDLGFLQIVSWTLVLLETWVLFTAIGVLVWVVDMTFIKMKIPVSHRIALALWASAILFTVFNFCSYNFHQFGIQKILSYQIDHNTTEHLMNEVEIKLWDMAVEQ